MRTHTLEMSIDLPRPIGEVFEFFADAGNLQEITPGWLDFAILTPRPIVMGVGTLIDYRLRIRGVPVRWRTRIAAWEPVGSFAPDRARFVDEQVRGPYRVWRHTHTFEALAASRSMPEGGTRCGDRVEFRSPGWVLEPLVHRALVRRDVERIFAYRARRLGELFARATSADGVLASAGA